MSFQLRIPHHVSNYTSTALFAAVFTLYLLLIDRATLLGLIIATTVGLLTVFGYRNVYQRPLPIPARAAVLITGCSSGIGEAAAYELVKLGFVVFAGVRKQADGKRLQQQAGNNLIPIILDVTNTEQIEQAYVDVQQMLQSKSLQLISLINNAGYSDTSPVELIPIDVLRRQFEVNVFGQIAVTQTFLPLLRSTKIVNHSARLMFLSSGAGRITMAGMAPYCASKYAIESLADGLRQELKKWNIDVSLIEPGAIATNFRTVAVTQRSANEQLSRSNAKCGDDVIASYIASNDEVVRRSPSHAPVSLVTDAIVAALLDPKPLPRYFAGRDVAFGIPLASRLPETISDALLGAPFRN